MVFFKKKNAIPLGNYATQVKHYPHGAYVCCSFPIYLPKYMGGRGLCIKNCPNAKWEIKW